jgi:diguanylate cyclase (GGDEF)-like protein
MIVDLSGLALTAWMAWRPGTDRAARRPWRWVALSWVLTIGGGIGLATANAPGAPAAMLWIGIGLRLAQLPALMIAVLLYPSHHLTVRQRVTVGLDAATVMGGGFMVMWLFLLGPALQRVGSLNGVSLVALAYLLEDLAIIIAVCAVVLRGGVGRLGHPLTPLLGGIVIFLGVDIYSSHKAVNSGTLLTAPGEVLPMYLALLTGLSLIALAAGMQARRGTGAAAEPQPGRAAASYLPYLALAVGYGMLASEARDELFPWGGLVFGVIVMSGAVAARQWMALRENHRLALIDPLTGLANRALLGHELDRTVGRAGTAVLLFDLDGFKGVNDTHGHDVGDLLLVEFARVVRQNVRSGDIAARLGGDEFAAVLPGVGSVEAAAQIADRIISAAGGIEVDEAVRGVRTSVGIALTAPDLSPSQLLRRADVAMYDAKRDRCAGWRAYAESPEDLVPAR